MRNRQIANLVLSLQAGPFCTSHSFARNMSDGKRRPYEEVAQCGGVAILLCSSSRGGDWVAFELRHNSRNDCLCWNRGLVLVILRECWKLPVSPFGALFLGRGRWRFLRNVVGSLFSPAVVEFRTRYVVASDDVCDRGFISFPVGRLPLWRGAHLRAGRLPLATFAMSASERVVDPAVSVQTMRERCTRTRWQERARMGKQGCRSRSLSA